MTEMDKDANEQESGWKEHDADHTAMTEVHLPFPFVIKKASGLGSLSFFTDRKRSN